MRLRNKLYFGILVLILGSYFFNIKFNFLNFGVLYFAVFAIICFGMLGYIKYERLSGKLLIVVLPLYMAVVIAVVSFFANLPDADYFLVGAFFILATVALCSFGFFGLFSQMEGQPLLAGAITALSLNAVLMLVMFISPEAQHSYLDLLTENGLELFGGSENALKTMHRFRMIGATGFSTYSVGFTQTIGLFLLAAYYYVTEKKLDFLFLMVSVLLAVSAVLAARSSLLGIFLWTIFCFIFFRLRFVLIFFHSSIFLVIIMITLIALISADGADFFANWLLELFTSGSDSDSLAETIQMLDIPFVDSGFYGFSRWFGDLGYDYFRSADVGFIRLILAGGFGVLFCVVLQFFLLGLVLFRGRFSEFFRTLYFFIMAYFFIIMFKGAILFDFFAFDFLMLMLGWIGSQTKDLAKIE